MSRKNPNHRPFERPPYADAVEAFSFSLMNAGVIKPGTFTMLEIRHDPWCKRPDGGPCTCTPDIGIAGSHPGEN